MDYVTGAFSSVKGFVQRHKVKLGVLATLTAGGVAAYYYIKSQVGDDEALLAKVTPDYAPMGKRTLQDNGSWLAALKRDNVELVPQGAVKRIIYEGMQTVVQF